MRREEMDEKEDIEKKGLKRDGTAGKKIDRKNRTNED